MEGLRMIVEAGTVVRLSDGTVIDGTNGNSVALSLSQVHHDDIPMPMPDGASPPFAWTFQPGGAHFDPPVVIEYPNMSALAPGAIANFLSFNHDTEQFDIIATGAVSADGSVIRSDPGVGISVSGWGCNCPPYAVTGDCCFLGGGDGRGAQVSNDCCDERCVDSGKLSLEGNLESPVVVGKAVVLLGDDLTFSVSPELMVSDSGGGKEIQCENGSSTSQAVPGAEVTFRYQILTPSGELQNGTGRQAVVNRTSEAGEYVCRFFASVERECRPADLPIGEAVGLAADIDITAVISNQLPGRECNLLPPRSQEESNRPMIMGAQSGNSAEIVLEVSNNSPAVPGLLAIVAESADGLVIAQEELQGQQTIVPFLARPGLQLYEAGIAVDSDEDGRISDNEILLSYRDRVMVVTATDYQEAVSTVSGQAILLIEEAQRLVEVFLGRRQSDGITDAVSGTRVISSVFVDPNCSGLTHPLGAEWSSGCTAEVPTFTYLETSRISGIVAANSAVEDLVKAALNTHIDEVRAFFSTSNESSAVFPRGDDVWPWGGKIDLRDWEGTAIELRGAFGCVTLAGEVEEVEIERDSLEVLRVVYNGGFEDYYDFDFNGAIGFAPAMVQAGFPTLGQAGRIFLTIVHIRREVESSLLGFSHTLEDVEE